MGNDAIYQKLIEMEQRQTRMEDKLDVHLTQHATLADSLKAGKAKAWGFWEKVIMVFVSAGVGAISARLGIK